MTYRLLLLVLAAALPFSGCKGAQNIQPPKTPAQVHTEALVRFNLHRLRDIDSELPGAAIMDLIGVGGPAMPMLIESLDDKSPEVRRGCILTIQHIAKQDYGYRGTFAYEADWTRRKRLAGQKRIAAWWRQASGTVPEAAEAPDKPTDPTSPPAQPQSTNPASPSPCFACSPPCAA